MSTRGWTTKPCPVCGSTNGRPTDKVCHECQQVYNDGKRLQDAFKQTVDKILVTHHSTYHWISRPYIMSGGGGGVSSKVTEKLTRAWSALTNAIAKEPGVPDPWSPERPDIPNLITNKKELWGITRDYRADIDNYFLVDRKLHAALNDYDTAVRIALEFCYTQGKLDGLNLLQQLNEGTESPSDFDDVEKRLNDNIVKIKGKLEETR